jgi:type IV secretion system protein VirB6
LVFAFFLIGLLIYSVEIYIVSLVVIALLVFISPIFIPMALFSATNGYFKAWLGELISVSLFPVILFGFIALMLAVFDRFYFGDCQSPSVSCTTYPFGTYAVQADPNSAGAQLHEAQPDWDNMTINGFDFNLFLLDLLKICFFAYLFFRFMGILGPFVSELVGSAKTDLSTMSSGAGQKVMGAGANAVKKSAQITAGAIKGAAKGGKAGAAKGAAEAAVETGDKGGSKGAARVDTTKS